MDAYLFTAKSRNVKTGPIPVTSAPKGDCAPDCPLIENGCYADNSHLGVMWLKLSAAKAGEAFAHGRATIKTVSWSVLCDKVKALPIGQLWRHDQMGDLPHNGGLIDASKLAKLSKSNGDSRGFTYTHHNTLQSPKNRAAIAKANKTGFTVNLSGNNLDHADKLAALGIAPVVTIVPANQTANTTTPAGRKVVICPATQRDDVTCKSCGLCQVQSRNCIIAFPAHGAGKAKAERV